MPVHQAQTGEGFAALPAANLTRRLRLRLSRSWRRRSYHLGYSLGIHGYEGGLLLGARPDPQKLRDVAYGGSGQCILLELLGLLLVLESQTEQNFRSGLDSREARVYHLDLAGLVVLLVMLVVAVCLEDYVAPVHHFSLLLLLFLVD